MTEQQIVSRSFQSGDSTSPREAHRRERLKARRKLRLDIHLFIALFAGAMLVVIGLTGSALVF